MPVEIRRVEGRYGSQAYINLLKEIVLPRLGIDPPNPYQKKRILFHDNFPVHCCKAVADWSHISGISLISLPMTSPDLMPLLKISEKVVYELGKQGILVSSKDDLWDQVSLMFSKVCTEAYIETLFDDIPNILNDICESGGNLV